MLQSKTSNAEIATGVSGEVSAVLRFNAASAVHGIAYHLVDEKLGRSVSLEAMTNTIKRLDLKGSSFTIARDKWSSMTNPQRLEWLLNQTQTLTLMGADDTVFLRARRTR